jgi:hypothetical protein
MIHGGVFVPRQYNTCAGIVHGQKTRDLLVKLVACGYGRPIQIGALHRGRLYHVTYKPLYAAIGEGDNRHRKRTSLGRMVQRLMLLDAVLADRTFTWLGTERDKYNYFVRLLHTRVEPQEFPHLRFGREPRLTVRYFPDKLPIGVQADRTEHVFLYLVTSQLPVDFRLFLYTHAELLRALPQWTIRVLVPQPFVKAIPRFGHAAREELATPLSLSQSQELQWWFRERHRRPAEGISPTLSALELRRRRSVPLDSACSRGCGDSTVIGRFGRLNPRSSVTRWSAVRGASSSQRFPANTSISPRWLASPELTKTEAPRQP